MASSSWCARAAWPPIPPPAPVIDLATKTTRIPLRKDLYFAYQYRLSNLPAHASQVTLKRVLFHPVM
ncbi:MAG: hypothetical protein B7Z66_08310 [Chromatiales bacterium 21-64-14]|nr:MAG: hypothetical protein B7Z66_08310 [Chromatiales bacterium 21-64-14]